VVYQHPLAYLLGVEGIALLRAFAGDYDRAFVDARVAEIRRLLDRPEFAVDGVEAGRVSAADGYRVWSGTYDNPGNGIFAYEEPYVHAIVDALPTGDALDAACGTGRHAAYLAGQGHRVIGVDGSPEMLEHARAKVPTAEFRHGDLHDLPVLDDQVDLVVCALALTHVPRLAPVLSEFVRVLRPGGHLVISDVHFLRVLLGSAPRMRDTDGQPGMLPSYRHLASDYLGAALPLGLRLRSCVEPVARPTGDPPAKPDVVDVGPWDSWPWSLLDNVPAAWDAAQAGVPNTVIWHFQRAAGVAA
jgi:SAM-dependent methyltransferase